MNFYSEFKLIPDPNSSKRLMSLYEEYENQSSPEARFLVNFCIMFILIFNLVLFRWVKDLDKLEMINQALIYEERDKIDLSGFFKSVEGRIATPSGKSLEKQIREEYSKLKK